MRKKIGELLIELGAISESELRNALGQQRAFGHGMRLGAVLVSMGSATPAAVARALARQFDVPFVELPEEIPPGVSSLVSLDFQDEHRVVPFRLEAEGRSERMHVAVEDPGDLSIVDELRFQLQKTLRVYVAASDDLERAIARARGETRVSPEAIALEESEVDPEMRLDGAPSMVAGGWFGTGEVPWSPPSPGALPRLEWEALPGPPSVTSVALPEPLLPPPRALESQALLDELLGGPALPPRPAATPRAPTPVPVRGAVEQEAAPRPTAGAGTSIGDVGLLEALERLAEGEALVLGRQRVSPTRMVAGLIRLLIRKRVIHEEELLDELSRN